MSSDLDTASVEHAKKRLKEGASDAEVRLELLARGQTAEQIVGVMNTVTPRVSFNWPALIVGFAFCLLAIGLFVTELRAAKETGEFHSKNGIAVLAALGVGISLRGFRRRH